MKKLGLFVLLSLAVVAAVGVYKTVSEPAHLYKHAGEFAGCPARPSCVSSLADYAEQGIEPLADTDLNLVATVIEEAGGVVVSRDADYIHAVFATPKMRYRDDVEVLRIGETLHWRSISRFGYRDFGVNRARLEDLRWELDRRS